MIDPPELDAIYATYEDQLEALTITFHSRHRLSADVGSRFSGMSSQEIQLRLERDRQELDRWVVMMLMASFEASVRTDAERRIQLRSRDKVRIPLRDLLKQRDHRARLVDILTIWEDHVAMTAARKKGLRAMLQHRHWLAHGRHWTNKHGILPEPQEARLLLNDYVRVIRANAADFPRR